MQNEKNIHHKKIVFLYSVAYVKQYLELLADSLLKKNESRDMLKDVLNKKEESRIYLTKQLYLLKILNKKLKNFNNLCEFIVSSNHLDWMINDFEINTFPWKHLFNYAFLNLQTLDQQHHKIGGIINETLVSSNTTNLVNSLLSSKTMIYDLNDFSINTHPPVVNPGHETKHLKLCEVMTKVLPSLQGKNVIDSKTVSLLNLLYNAKVFQHKIQKSFIKSVKPIDLEIFLYAYKLALLCSRAKPNSFYGGRSIYKRY